MPARSLRMIFSAASRSSAARSTANPCSEMLPVRSASLWHTTQYC